MHVPYRGRLAPTPTGYLHLGHAATFLTAAERARQQQGTLLLRVEDLDAARCQPLYREALLEDLSWLGLTWAGEPVLQSQRGAVYLSAWKQLQAAGFIYPCLKSRRDVEAAAQAPHEEEAEPIFPTAWRPPVGHGSELDSPAGFNWRFRVPDGETVGFVDGRVGSYAREAGQHFGDFLVWRRDGVPAYELAVVADDADQGITEVVRGEDLLLSTCRQLLVYRALGKRPPEFFHTPLLRDEHGRRLAKRQAALSLRALREKGLSPDEVFQQVEAARMLPSKIH